MGRLNENKRVIAYDFPSLSQYLIEPDENTFRLWLNGCGIGREPSLSDAKETISKRAIQQLKAEAASLRSALALIEKALEHASSSNGDFDWIENYRDQKR